MVQRKGQSFTSAEVLPQRDWNTGLVLAEVALCLINVHKVLVELVEVQVVEGDMLLVETILDIDLPTGSGHCSQTRRESTESVVGSDMSFVLHNRSV